MGLLDNLLFGSSADFGGQQGGLLDFLRNSQAQNNQYQPSAGLPPIPSFADRFNAAPNAPQPFNPAPRQMDASSFDPATFAPNQARPLPVGNNYQMPRIGSADLYQPQQAMLPPNAQPTQGQLPPQVADANAQMPQGAPQAASQLPPALGGGISALGRIGNPDGLIARLTGNDSRSIAQQNLKAQYDATRQALIANGVPERQANSTAMLAVMNPEAGKTVLPELLTNKEKLVMKKDAFGNEVPYWSNEREQTFRRAEEPGSNGGGAASGDVQGMTDKITQMRTQGATKEQMLAQIPTGYRDDVASLLSGKAVPANMGRAQSRMALLTLAKVVDPNFDETQIPGRVKMRSDFMGEGKNGQAIGALNTVQHHADQVSDSIEEFQKAGGGSDSPLWNAGKLLLANNTSYDPKLRDAAQKLKDKLNATEHEVASAYNAGHLSDHDLKTWNEIKAENLPAGQLKQKLADFVDLLNGKRDSLNHMYRQQFGEDAPAIDKEANIATTAKIHQRLPQYGGAASSGLPSGWSVTVR